MKYARVLLSLALINLVACGAPQEPAEEKPDLDEAALIEILTQPKNALVKQYERLFEMEDVTLQFTDDALKAIAQKAIARKTGARGLRSIMEGILLDTMFDLPGYDGVEEVVLNGEVVEGRAKPLLSYADRRGDVGTSA